MTQSYESTRAALDEVIMRYRGDVVGDRHGLPPLSRELAIEMIRALGFTRGDALRWLDSERRRP